MLDMYLTSVLVYMIIIYCMCGIFANSMRDNGWASNETVKTNTWVALFMLSAVPILRIAAIVLIFYMATHTKEKFEKWQAEVREKKNEGE